MERKFNRSQVEAIEHFSGPAMILAGPGSGKTTVITQRIKYLIEKKKVKPENILVITFTKAAATEMKERFDKLVPESQNGFVTFGTFHSVFFRILKIAYQYNASNIVREDQQIEIIRNAIHNHRVETEDEAELAYSILSEISKVKSEMLDLTYYYAKSCSEELFKRLYKEYEECMMQKRLIDFDDMMILCYELFSQRNDILSAWQNKFKYILIDEFQDINKLQYNIVKMLAKPENNLFIVGDDDQSIYRFRGAKPEIMLGFEKDYPDCHKVLLSVNYRSTIEIVKTSEKLISNNKTRFEKSIEASHGNGRPVSVKIWNNQTDENLAIIKEMMDYKNAGYHYGDIAVLYRTNHVPRFLVEKLMEYNIPFYMGDRIPNLYGHWISKDIITYIKIALGSRDRADFFKIMNRPQRYISREAFENKQVNFQEIKNYYLEKQWIADRLKRLEYDLLMIETMAPAAAVIYIRKAIGYETFLREFAKKRKLNEDDLLEILDELQESASHYTSFQEWFCHMDEYEEKLKDQEQKQKKEQNADGVILMTMHSAKGLEFDIVYIIDTNEGIVPHHKAMLEADLEEERRLFYVAITRSRQRLHIYAVKERYGRKQDISRFIREITP